jgi:glycosyltransferase involved in cell wall biosynthesis
MTAPRASAVADFDHGTVSEPTTELTVVVATLMRPTGETGVQTHFNGLLRYLERHEARASRVTPFSAPGILVYPVFGARRVIDPLSGPLSVWWYRRWHASFLRLALSRELAKAGSSTVVYAQCPVSAAVALEARRVRDQRVIMAVHFNVSQADEWADKGRIRTGGRLHRSITAFEERVLPRLDGIVYVSKFMRDVLEARVPAVRRVRSAVIPNFVDVPTSTARPQMKGDLVSVGTLEPRKNQAYLLEILSAARRLGHTYTLTLVGDGPDRHALERRAHQLEIGDQVRFLGFRPDAARLIGEYRAYCHAARIENFGLALLEAMASGRPVFTTPSGGTSEVLRDGIEGVFLPFEAPQEAAGTLVSCMEDLPRLECMGAAGRARATEHFSADAVVPQLLDFLGG